MAKITTADLLIEVGTEELPPKALRQLRDAFAAAVVDGLQQNRLTHGDAKSFASPRRLALLISDLAGNQEDRQVLQKGPPVSIAFDSDGNATKAALAFAKKCGVSVGELNRQQGKGGEWLIHDATESGRPASEIVPGVVQMALDALPVPRRMRWGNSETEFVRPVHWLVMLHGKTVIDASIFGVTASNRTRGHRFHAPDEMEISSAQDYASLLATKGFVVADFDERRETIVSGVRKAADAVGGSPVGNDALYDEVTALTEWPVPVTGSFDQAYLQLPGEVIIATLTSHQRYFPLQNNDGELLPAFITVANIESKEPLRVRDGNERVIRPRLADAVFFWETDQQTPLADRRDALSKVVYQKGLGSLADKAARVAKLAEHLAAVVNADSKTVSRAAALAKCDLLTGIVGEFPELQGTMGGYYAAADGESELVCAAISEQYRPRFAGDDLPGSLESQVLSVADKLDTLAGVFAIGKKPTGNRDPFGLRRATLGVIRILNENSLDVDLPDMLSAALQLQPVEGLDSAATEADLQDYFIDRLRSYLLDGDNDLSADMFAAVRARSPRSLLDFQHRILAVKAFMRLDASASLAAANKRIANILRKAKEAPGATDPALFTDTAEKSLHTALLSAKNEVQPLIDKRAYAEALQMLSALRQPVDVFFDDVMVMAEDAAIRNNRLALLTELRALFLDIADISRITPAQD